jgi:hypothetical protein
MSVNPLESKSVSKRTHFGKDSNVFNGVEQIDLKNPSNPQISGTANRSRQQYMGFENKYFRPTRGRSPSPMPEDQDDNIFGDEEDHDYHYEDN